MSRHRAEILFGSPQDAERILRREGLNYFFVSTRLPIFDALHCTPVFSPDTMQRYLDVVWTDGADALLTWKRRGGDALPREWVEKYRKAVTPNRHLSDCGSEGPRSGLVGRRIAAGVAEGARWGADIPLPK